MVQSRSICILLVAVRRINPTKTKIISINMEFCLAKFSKSVARTSLKIGLSVFLIESNMGRNVFLSGSS